VERETRTQRTERNGKNGCDEERFGEACNEKKMPYENKGPKDVRDDELKKISDRARQQGVNHLFVTCYKPRNHLTSVVITGEGEIERAPPHSDGES
jgi:hypothetical protein